MRNSLIPILILVSIFEVQAQTNEEYQERLERIEDLTETIERYCLSGHEVSGDANLEAGISGLKKVLTDGLSGSLSAEGAAREARGAVGILEDKIKHKENAGIRKCMQPHLEKIVNYLLVEEAAGDEGQCWDIKLKHPKRFPYYLKNTIAVTRGFYWFYIDINNRCSSTLYASVTFKPDLPERDMPIIDYLKSAERISPKAGERLDKTIDPRIRILGRFERSFTLKVHWDVKDDKQNLLDQGSVDIQVLPRNQFVWGLRNADGQPVDKEILLASLAAWAQGQQKQVVETSNRVLDAVIDRLDAAPAEVARSWMAAVHDDLFGGERGIKVLRTAKRFPPRRPRPIRSPGEILKLRRSDPLEAALLISAVSSGFLWDYGFDMIMVVAPDPERSRRQNVLLAWAESGTGNWSAIRTDAVGREAFEDNLEGTTAAFNRLLQSSRTLAEGLDALDAAYGDCDDVAILDEREGVYTLDFLRAKECGIGGLPF
jgi:hypothetical protein